jgi:(1->4)-alpha-D-glucan 1-alpha-D-glucosylmutase
VGPVDAGRLHGYLVKAVREAKQHTTWVAPDEEYESRVLALADLATRPGPLRELLDAAVERNRAAIRAVVLGQKLLQLMLPGVPDSYQGCEVVNLALVDPDNRRPVDYDALEGRLRSVAERPAGLDEEKLLVTQRALRVRNEFGECFGELGGYAPLETTTEHAFGFVRGERTACVVSRAPQRLDRAGGWRDHSVLIPPGSWHDELTGAVLSGGPVPCATVFAQLPVALLVSR